MKIYLASSWRNPHQSEVLASLRHAGFDVYDFKNPAPGNNGFGWRQCTDEPLTNAAALCRTLLHPIAQRGFDYDVNAMKWADACVLLLPCGNSAHLEAGWFSGRGKPVAVLAIELREPELLFDWIDKPNIGQSRAEWRTPLFAHVDALIDHMTVNWRAAMAAR